MVSTVGSMVQRCFHLHKNPKVKQQSEQHKRSTQKHKQKMHAHTGTRTCTRHTQHTYLLISLIWIVGGGEPTTLEQRLKPAQVLFSDSLDQHAGHVLGVLCFGRQQ